MNPSSLWSSHGKYTAGRLMTACALLATPALDAAPLTWGVAGGGDWNTTATNSMVLLGLSGLGLLVRRHR